MTKKTCSQCGVPKDLEDFHNLKTSRDGKRSECRACRNAWRREARGTTNKPEKKSSAPEFSVGDTVSLSGLKGVVVKHQGSKIILWDGQTWSYLDKEISKLVKKVG